MERDPEIFGQPAPQEDSDERSDALLIEQTLYNPDLLAVYGGFPNSTPESVRKNIVYTLSVLAQKFDNHAERLLAKKAVFLDNLNDIHVVYLNDPEVSELVEVLREKFGG
jgi:hypothetical protein